MCFHAIENCLEISICDEVFRLEGSSNWVADSEFAFGDFNGTVDGAIFAVDGDAISYVGSVSSSTDID